MSPFDEDAMRSDIVNAWGPAGAHVDLFDSLVRKSVLIDYADSMGRLEEVQRLLEDVLLSIQKKSEFADGRAMGIKEAQAIVATELDHLIAKVDPDQ